VVIGDQKYALQLTPSGVFYDTVTPVIGNGVVVDLPTLFKEIDSLESRGISTARLKVSSLAHLIFPWHQAIDAALEAARGDSKIGTTLKGIGPAYVDKVKRAGIRVGEVLNITSFEAKVRERAVAARREVSDIGGDTFDIDQVVSDFVAYAQRLAPYVADTVNLLHDARERGEHILLEGAQATFLDVDHGTYPYVTSSNPIAGGAAVGTGLGPRHIDRVVGIAKAYTTRVGMGPFPSELTDDLGDKLVDIGREFGTVTGRRRRTGWLDTVMLRHAMRVNSLTEIALTKLDVLDTFEEVKVCVAYKINGEIVRNYPDTVERLAQVEPVYETLAGWMSSTEGITEFSQLPRTAQDLVKIVERETGIPVSMVGTGPARDSMVVR
jgi:adenylosuccinate synthase